MSEAKPFSISKHLVVEAFEKDLKDNLYKVWNRMSSGSYFPPPVRLVEIPKGDGRTRPLGIPTVADRIAQMVVKQTLEPLVEPFFHRASYGYRPGKSALDAVGVPNDVVGGCSDTRVPSTGPRTPIHRSGLQAARRHSYR